MTAVVRGAFHTCDATGLLLQHDLVRRGHASASGDEVASWLDVDAFEWLDFASHWDRLSIDRHMADGGRYRYRRYDAVQLWRPAPLHLLPHAPYEQSLDVNPLNGGVPRDFDPLEPGFVRHRVLARLLDELADVLDATKDHAVRWRIDLHPYRIRADDGMCGLPTPEGLHRDGVDFIATWMVRRCNVSGGESLVTDAERTPMHRQLLREPMDLLLADDRRTLHAVTPVRAVIPVLPAYRDVLVIAFTEMQR